MYRQYDLRSGNREMFCWLNDANLKVGQQLTLEKDPEAKVWTIHYRYQEISSHPQWRTWKVGGLK